MNSVVSVSRLPPVEPHFLHAQNVVSGSCIWYYDTSLILLHLPQTNLSVTSLFFTAPRASKRFFWCNCWSSLRSDAGANSSSSSPACPERWCRRGSHPAATGCSCFLMLMMSKRSFVRYSLTVLADPLVCITDYMAVHVSKNELAANSKAETIR